MNKNSRIQITPKGALLKIPPKLRNKFAEEAVEVIMEEERFEEIVNRIITGITGLTQSGFISEAATAKPVKAAKNKKQNVLPVVQTALKPDLYTKSNTCTKMLQDPDERQLELPT